MGGGAAGVALGRTQPTVTRPKRILSLFDYTGIWSQPYADAGYRVTRVDLQHGLDCRTIPYDPAGYHGILAAPPCDVFTVATTRFWGDYDGSGLTDDGLALVDCALRAVAIYRPAWWALENPGAGRLRRYIGEPAYRFHPYHHGDPYHKLTAIWGDFNEPERAPVTPTDTNVPGQTAISLLPPGPNRKNIRAATPAGFAAAFFAANP